MIELSEELQKFIETNIDLIELNTKLSWETVYQNIRPITSVSIPELIGEFTTLMIRCGADPAKVLEYVPPYYLYKSNISNYDIPSNVINISFTSFAGCTNLHHITIPLSVRSIDSSAFTQSSIQSVYIPTSVKSILYNVFGRCEKLESIVLSEGLQIIGSSAFKGCSRIREIILPSTIEYVDSHAFSNCTNLERFVLNNTHSLQFGESVFSDCTSLTLLEFTGTKKELILTGLTQKSRLWRNLSRVTSIVCTDGEIVL